MDDFKLIARIIMLLIEFLLLVYYIWASIYLGRFKNDRLQYIREDCVDYSNEFEVRCLKKQLILKNRQKAFVIILCIALLSIFI
ncbi:hypothetical protein [Clostridium baratii]|uniref:hypothetical protein n=1 Tax=Clostridium baratii TaxID=1561 RepID=UPI00097FB021|nr:hypothetical protein [Clostridium baratii]AQM58521.1 hypothetical protein NPD11_3015 [Clostridium baratii]